MKNAVWKFPIEIKDEQRVQMPDGAEVVYVAVQNGTLCLWAAVDSSAAMMPRRFFVRETGHDFTGAEGRHLGSFQLADGAQVFHVFGDVAVEGPA